MQQHCIILCQKGSKQTFKMAQFAKFPLFVEHCCKKFCMTKHSMKQPNPLYVIIVSFTQTGNVHIQFNTRTLYYNNVKH